MDIWEVLQGRVQQQRVWTFGKQAPAAAAAADGEEALDAADDPDAFQAAAIASAAAAAPRISSQEPLSIRDGVRFTACAAGRWLGTIKSGNLHSSKGSIVQMRHAKACLGRRGEGNSKKVIVNFASVFCCIQRTCVVAGF
jgi:hypothetical protein